MTKEQAKGRLDNIDATLSDGDCGRFYTYEQCQAMAAEGREICAKWGFDVPYRMRLSDEDTKKAGSDDQDDQGEDVLGLTPGHEDE
jgi:hypothetical protein